jgi:hypothetical protein
LLLMAVSRADRPVPDLTAAEFGVARRSRATSSDGKRIGEVCDVRGHHMKIRRRFYEGPDCWLDVANIVAVVDDEVIFDFAKRDLDEHCVPEQLVVERRIEDDRASGSPRARNVRTGRELRGHN